MATVTSIVSPFFPIPFGPLGIWALNCMVVPRSSVTGIRTRILVLGGVTGLSSGPGSVGGAPSATRVAAIRKVMPDKMRIYFIPVIIGAQLNHLDSPFEATAMSNGKIWVAVTPIAHFLYAKGVKYQTRV